MSAHKDRIPDQWEQEARDLEWDIERREKRIKQDCERVAWLRESAAGRRKFNDAAALKSKISPSNCSQEPTDADGAQPAAQSEKP